MPPARTREEIVSLHEAAHATAAFILDAPIHDTWVRRTGGRVTHGPARKHDDDVDPFGTAVVCLAGAAFTGSLGLTHGPTESDQLTAAKIVVGAFSPGAPVAVVHEAFELVEATARRFVCEPRFRSLATRLGTELAGRQMMIGFEVESFLRDRDPERPRRSELHAEGVSAGGRMERVSIHGPGLLWVE